MIVQLEPVRRKTRGDESPPDPARDSGATGTLPLSSPAGAARRLRDLAGQTADPTVRAIAEEFADWLEATLDRVLLAEAQVLHLRADLDAIIRNGVPR